MHETGLDTIPADLRSVMEWARGVKNAWGGDIPWHINIRRGGRLLCGVISREVSRDEGLDLAAMAVAGFGADGLEAAFDTHMADERFIKKFGRTPDPHELARLCEEGACEMGLITDAICVTTYDRSTKTMMYGSLPYHAHGGEDIRWQDDRSFHLRDDPNSEAHMSGIVPDGIRHCFELQTMEEALLEEAQTAGFSTLREFVGQKLDPADASDEEIRFHQDMGVLSLVARTGAGVMWAPADEEEAKRVAQAMSRHGLTNIDQDGNLTQPVRDTRSRVQDVLSAVRIAARKAEYDRIHAEELEVAAKRRRERGEEGVRLDDLLKIARQKVDVDAVTQGLKESFGPH